MSDGERIAPEGVRALKPALDVTSADLVSGIITEKGIVAPLFRDGLSRHHAR